MQVELNYGRRSLPVELPDDLQVTMVRKPVMPVLTDPVAAVRRAFQYPVGSISLDSLARGARSATIAICDITRPVPNHWFLRPLIETMLRAGIPAKGILVLVATGLHRPNLGAELDELIGDPWVLRSVRVENHYATGLSPAERALTGVRCVESVHSAVLDSVAAGGDPAVAIIPEGPYVVPFFKSS